MSEMIHGGLEKELTMGWFNKKKNNGIANAAEHIKGKLENEKISRREFGSVVKNAAIVATGTAIGLNAIPSSAFASENSKDILKELKKIKYSKTELFHLNQQKNNWNKLPPGYANCRDYILDLIYGDEIENIWNFGGNYETGERLNRRIGIKGEQVLWQTQYLEPAFYFLGEKLSKSNHFRSYHKEMAQINLPLAYFEKGVHNYFTQWHRRFRPGGAFMFPKDVEREFLNSIFAAAYMRADLAVKETQNYLQLTSMQEKAKKLQETMNIFKGLSKDITSADPENGYNRCLVASWSSFMLVNDYWLMAQKENDLNHQLMRITNDEMETPLRKYIPKIRGPPYYINKKI